ncbi:MAG: ABC transporter ATP-binding protein [Spirochaetales bacterium]|nr:ABC transporter ATP-binding protein [Spirochaetales bacterium]
MPASVVIETEGLTKRYGTQVAVDHLDLRVEEGEIFGFLGPNGAGKTTTLLMLIGLTEPSEGKARVLGWDPQRDPIRIKLQVGYLQENMGFYREMNAREMLRFIGELNGIEARETDRRIEAALDQVGLEADASKPIGNYSRGMRQRLGLAEILLREPKIVFLDEPTLGLDPEGANRIIELIDRMCRDKGMTVLLSSHDLYKVQRICHRVGIMARGRMVVEAATSELAVGGKTMALEELYLRYFREERG